MDANATSDTGRDDDRYRVVASCGLTLTARTKPDLQRAVAEFGRRGLRRAPGSRLYHQVPRTWGPIEDLGS